MIPSGNDIKLLITTINDLYKKGSTIEAQEKIMDLREMVQSLRETCVDLREENMILKGELAKKESVEFEGGVYWKKKEDGSKDGPFCPPCHDNNGKLIRMTHGENYYMCPVQGCRFSLQHTKRDRSGQVRRIRGPNSWMAS